MNLNYQFRRLVFLQVLLGIMAFCMAEPNPGMLVLAGSLGFMSWYVTEGPNGRPLPRWLINLGSLVAVAWLLFDLRWHQGHVIVVMGHFTIWLQVLLLYSEKRNREYGQLLVLSLMMMIGASVLSVSMIYGILLMAYCIVTLLSLLMFHFKSTSDMVLEANRAAAGDRGQVAPPGAVVSPGYRWQFRSAAVVIGICCALTGLMIFVVMPRQPGAALPHELEGRIVPQQVGFSQNVDLNSSPMSEGSQEPVMNVTLTLNGRPYQSDALLLRGAALDEYDPDLRVWRRSAYAGSQSYFYGLADDELVLARLPESSRVYNATITQRRSGLRIMFTHHPTTRIVSSNLKQVQFNTMDQQLEAGESISGAVVYEIEWPIHGTGGLAENYEETLEETRRYQFKKPTEPRDLHEQQRYATGWPVNREQIAELTRSVLREHDLDRDPDARFDERDQLIVQVLKKWLQQNFQYQLYNPNLADVDDPMTEFLIRQRMGHCEFYASAVAAMTRSIGMQARVVTGYRVSEYNRIGGYYVVRHSHAHAWAEVNLGPELGWQTVDATPPEDVNLEHAVSDTFLRSIRELYEHLEFAWIKSVVAYDQRTRQALLSGMDQYLKRAASDPRHPIGRTIVLAERLMEIERLDRATTIATLIVAIALLMAFVVLIRTLVVARRRYSSLHLESVPVDLRRDMSRDLMFYLTMSDMLERHGYRRPSWQSPQAFAESLRRADPHRFDAVKHLTDSFYRLRFGRHALDAFNRQRIKGLLRDLEQSITHPT